MNRTLFFYHMDDYYDFKELKSKEGYSFISITKLIHQNTTIQNLDSTVEIIDISSITEYTNIQSVAEQVIYSIDEDMMFICDSSKRESIEYKLRLIFEQFQDIDNTSFLKKESVPLAEKGTDITKKHKKIIDLSDEELEFFFSDFRNGLYGHEKFKDDFEDEIRTFRIFNKLGENKILSLFLMGESGVGKTEVARTIFNCLKGEKSLAKINFGNYGNEFSLSSLIGSARGYIGSDDGEVFMKVRDTDIGVLLIDEFEKSNSTLFNYFLEVLESGRMTSSLGGEMDLNGFIIIFTSNITKEDFPKRISPELRSRFDYKCMFTLLSDPDKQKYIEYRANSIAKKVKIEHGIDFEDNLKNYLITQINVRSFNNMRDINKQIRKQFLSYLKEHHISESKETENISKISTAKRFLSLFTV